MTGGVLLGNAGVLRSEGVKEGILGGPAPAASHEEAVEATLYAAASPLIPRAEFPETVSPSLSTDALRSYGRVAKAEATSSPLSPTAATEEPAEAPKPAKKVATARSSRYFIQPTSGTNWGILHASNAIDIANSCGTPVIAAAEGIVTSDGGYGSGSWNGGYGNYVMIEHPNGAKTRYAHLEKIKVSVGTAVAQGEQIGTIGNTGKVHGATGCHLHFEVTGMANPFAKR